MDKQPLLKLIPDMLGEGRHQFVAKLAHRFWEHRGSPEVDWFAAEQAMYPSSLASGLIAPPDYNRHTGKKIYS
jgi:hypothetical protein